MPIPYTTHTTTGYTNPGSTTTVSNSSAISMIIMFGVGAFFIGLGIVQLSRPLDEIWEGYQRVTIARGRTPQRREQWDVSTRVGMWIGIGIGIFMCVLGLVGCSITANQPPQRSGVFIEGRELTQEQWDGCHHNIADCVADEMNRKNASH